MEQKMKAPVLEILCATRNQEDFSKIREMNVRCDIVFANQADRFDYAETRFSGRLARMMTTRTVGVGKNRNYALSLARGDILLFADDDMVYEDDLEPRILAAFEDAPQADMILFGIRYEKEGRIYKVRQSKTGKLPFFRSLRYGTVSMAVRREAVLRHGLHFSELFGGGCRYAYGEDTDLLLQCFRKGLGIYSHAYILGTTRKDSSTCFSGFAEKYYFDKGALARHSFGPLAGPYMAYMALKPMEASALPRKARLRCLLAGWRHFPGLSWEEWMKKDEETSHRQ